MRRKIRIIRLILTEIVIMALGVLCCVMPTPWRLIVPIIIGTRSILIKARLQLKQPRPPETIQGKITETNKDIKSHAEKKQTAGKAKRQDAVKTGNKKSE